MTRDYDITNEAGVDIVHAKFWDDCEGVLGTYMDESNYDMLVNTDTDFYSPNSDVNGSDPEDVVIFKYRKNVFSAEEQSGAYDGLLGAAQPTQNRGLAAGPRSGRLGGRDWFTNEQSDIMDHYINGTESTLFDTADGDPVAIIREKYAQGMKSDGARGMVWLRTKIYDSGYNYDTFFDDIMEEWKGLSADDARESAKLIRATFISDTSYANAVLSGIAGFFDRYPRIPFGRATSYTENNYDDYVKCYPFMERLSTEFKKHMPRRFARQTLEADKLDDRFRVGGKLTPFTTITVNKNFRTACHRDAGDLSEGFSNLTVIAKDKEWAGGFLVLPEFRVAIDIRPGDLLLINNHVGIHGNTEIIPPDGKTIGEMERISVVCYFREKMLLLGSKDYEDTRREYVDSRRLNKEHPMWRNLWNGISSGMWDEEEWYTFLSGKLGVDTVNEYHPTAYESAETSLDDFF